MPAVLLIMLAAGHIKEYAVIAASMFLHELGHILMAVLLRKRICSIRILPVGFNAVFQDNDLKSFHNVLIYAGGPAVNIIAFTTSFAINGYCFSQTDGLLFFSSANIYLAVFNLLPVIPLDGGMVLREILAGCYGVFLANRYAKIVNRILSVLFLTLGIAQILASLWNFSLIFIGLYTLFSFSEEETEAALMNVKNIVYRRARLVKKGIYQARDLVVMKSVQMGEILKCMDFDRFHIVYVLDDELKIAKVLTEQEIIDGLLKYNSDITFQQFIDYEKKV